MTLIEHAKFELELNGLMSEEGDFYGGMTGQAVMELIEVFSKQGHSGMSSRGVISLFSILARFEPIGPITGKDEEWTFLDYTKEIMYQNKRCSGVFKDNNGVATYNSAIIKRCPNGTTWSGPLYMTREDAINGTNRIEVAIKEFPFTPKIFYIDVLEEEIKEGDWIMWVKDAQQLEEVFEYYKQI